MRPFPIGDQSDGINLLRSKGGASPRGLFDLVNAWVTPQKIIKARPGAGDPFATAPAGTLGGVGFEDKLHVFAGEVIASADANIVVHVLRHPSGGSAALTKIHKAFPFLGRLYVVAEWADGVLKHHWLQGPPAWAASTSYELGAVVSPSAVTGFVYEITNEFALNVWTADTEYAINDEVLPTTPNGFKYRVTATAGTPPRSGATEPDWPTTESATVTDFA